jgi:hypothetical protein
VKLAHRINEDVAQTIKAHPGRFGGFATLPLPHVEASLRAIEHTTGKTHGRNPSRARAKSRLSDVVIFRGCIACANAWFASAPV